MKKVLSELYHFHFKSERRERLFLASVGFVLAVGIVRLITLMIHIGVGPFHNVSAGGTHIHHLVWGILILLGIGYVWLDQEGTGQSRYPTWFSRATAIAFGVGAALTLDEFALWLNLQDVYWQGQGRESIDALLLFAGALFVGILGGQFVRAVFAELLKIRRQI
jgi:hypothetical protein